jgi:hypothetical protein
MSCVEILEMLGKTVTSDGQPQTEDEYKKVVVEIC